MYIFTTDSRNAVSFEALALDCGKAANQTKAAVIIKSFGIDLYIGVAYYCAVETKSREKNIKRI